MSAETELSPQPTPSSAEDWGAPEPGERRSPPLQPDNEPEERPDPDNAAIEGDDEPDEPAKGAAEEDPIGDDPDESDKGDGAPEFWSAEDKEFWKSVPPELRPVLKKYEQKRIEFVNAKAQEAAAERAKAADEAKRVGDVVQQAASWWEQNGPKMAQAFGDKWSRVDFKTLAAENPAEYVRMKEERDAELALLQEAHRRGEADRETARKTVEENTKVARQTEHAKLAQEFPKEFGTPEIADKTYRVLAGFLAKNGIPDNVINQTYEAPIVKIIRKAYKYDQLQAKAKGITDPQQLAQSASKTPTRVAPGARSSANPVSNATRQAEERLRSGARLTHEEAAAAFR